ncbi:CD209 antigen-like protein C isoform X2 [Lissotriton helveticus]
MAIAVGILTRCKIHSTEMTPICLNFTLENYSASLMLETLKEHLCGSTEPQTQVAPVCKLCPSGWLLTRGRCYFFSEAQWSWEASQEHCRKQESDLLTIQHENEMDLLDRMGDGADFIWTGYEYNETQKRWTWKDEATSPGYRMKMQNGNLSNQKHSCGAYRKREIHRTSCLSLNQWICVKKAFQFEF